MRREFFVYLYELMKKNKNIIALTGDLGMGGFDRIRDEIPDRFINCGAAEQAMLDIACGLAMEGKIPIVYSITPFLLYRPFETWRTYINHEKILVILIGSGRDKDYSHDGFSHDASDIYHFMNGFSNIKQYYPESIEQMKIMLNYAIESKQPHFISLKR